MASLTLYVGNDNVLTLSGLQNSVDDSYINNATVTVTLVDSDGNSVSGETWPVTLSYVSGSDGNYRATLADTISASADTAYRARVTADGGAGLKGYWEIPVYAVKRTS